MERLQWRFVQRALLASVLLLLVSSFAVAFQTTGEVRGVVTDSEKGTPLIGANVSLVGTQLGAATNLDGMYSIKNVPPGQYSVLVRYVGYRQQSKDVNVATNETVTADFALSVIAFQMDEVVVTGQGTAIEKRKLASPIETISAKEVSSAPVTSINELLQSRVPGMISFNNSGQPGTGGRIRTRGIRSAVANQTPVIFVDGVRVDNQDNYRLARGTGGLMMNSLSDIVVGNIERVEVIKGGAAATLYGSDAANGVIQIFTKKGYAGAPRWTFSTTQGIDLAETQWTREQYTKDKLLRDGQFQNYVVNVTGGTDAATYNVTGRMQLSEGTVQKLTNRLYNFGGGLRASLAEKVSVDFSAGFTNALYGNNYNNNAIASPLTTSEIGDYQRLAPNNPDSLLAVSMLPELQDNINRFTSGLTAHYTPYDFLSSKLTIGVDYRKNEQRNFNPIASAQWTSTPGGGLFRSDRDYLQISLDASATVSYPKEGDITSTTTVGVQGFREEDRQQQTAGTNFPVPGTDDFDNAATITASESNQQLFQGGFYILETVGLLDRIFLDLGIRVDGNSAFGKDAGLQTYPKAGIAYNISDEAFWPIKEYVNSFKLRAAYGLTGKFPNAFTRDKTFTAGTFQQVGVIGLGNPGDPSLKPEKTTTVEFGFDAGILDDMIGLQFTYYTENTKDALFTVAQEPASGYISQLKNVGEIENKGMEFAVTAVPISTSDYEVSIRASLATLENKVVSLGGSAAFSIGGFAFLPLRVEEGKPIGIFRVNRPTPEAGAGTYEANVLDEEIQPTPKYTGSFGVSATLFRDIRINVLADYSYGGYVLNTGSVLRFFEGMEPEASRVPTGYNFQTASIVWLEKADWVKIREISVRYQLPSSFYEAWGLRGIAVNASIRNVAAFTTSKEVDPELNGLRAGGQLDVGGIGYFPLSPPKEVRFGVEVSL
jgi:TonB-dependent SusC/RagA subfamily outer membrane receptor